MNRAQRHRFDTLLEEVLAEVPPRVRALLEETPLVVEDLPSRELLILLDMEDVPEELCGLHTGTPITERTVEGFDDLPEMIYLFRIGIVEEAGGWRDETRIKHEIRITLLHEIGHHFGLEEDDLDELGYG